MIAEILKRLENLAKRISALESKESRTSMITLVDGITAPSTVTSRAFIYIDTADGDLKIKYGDGTTKTIVVDT